MTTPSRKTSGKILAGIGVTIILAEVLTHFFAIYAKFSYEMSHHVVVIGALIGFVGFWIIDPTNTKRATEVITDNIPRFGRRKTDASAVPESITTVIPKPHTSEHSTVIKTEISNGGTRQDSGK